MTSSEIRSARKSRLFGQLTLAERLASVKDALSRAYLLRGLEPSDEEMAAPIQEVESKISHSYPGLTQDEVWLCMEAGVSGKFGGDRKMVIANYFYWLASYWSSEARTAVIRDEARHPVSDYEGYRLTPQEIAYKNEQAGRRGALRLFVEMKTTGTMDILLSGYGAMVYDYLVSKGKIRVTEETVQRARRLARQEHRRGVFDSLLPGDVNDYGTKNVLLRIYFQSLIDRGVNLQLA